MPMSPSHRRPTLAHVPSLIAVAFLAAACGVPEPTTTAGASQTPSQATESEAAATLPSPSIQDADCDPEQTVETTALSVVDNSVRLEPLDVEVSAAVHLTASAGRPDRLFIVERAGRILVADADGTTRRPLLDIRTRVRTEIEEGMHSMALHPAFDQNGLFYVAYNDRRGDIRVTEFHALDGVADAREGRDLLVLDKPEGIRWHNGGQLAFGPDGLLYLGLGDASRNPLDPLPNPHPPKADPQNHAQDPDLPWGKLLRMDVRAPADRASVFAVGLRNPWRFSFDRETGDLYIGDVGQTQWEEIDYVAARFGETPNFGWSVCEGVDRYKDEPITAPGAVTGPVAVYRHAAPGYCAGRGTVVGGFAYRGSAIPQLVGRYLFGDYCTGEMWTIRVADGRAIEAERLGLAHLPRLVSFGEDGRGELYAISLTQGIYRVVAAD